MTDRGDRRPAESQPYPGSSADMVLFFAAGSLSSYYSGEVLTPIGGETLPG